MLNKFKIFLVLVLLQMPLAYADTKPVTQLKTFLASTKTLTANFKQVVFDETGKVKQTSYGVFNLSRPGKFRWNYQKPFTQEIVSNSGKVWFYDADLEQVTIKRLDKSMGSTPALLLTGDVELEKEFTMERQGAEDGMQWVKLVPKNPESNFKYVLIGLNDGELGGMELSDNFGQLTRIYFSEVEINPQLKSDEFTFVIPKGVDVLEDKEQDKPKFKAERKHKDAEKFQDNAENKDGNIEKLLEKVENKEDGNVEKPQEKVETTAEKPLESEPKKEPVQIAPVEVQPEETVDESVEVAEPVQPRHKTKAKLHHTQEKSKETSDSNHDKHKDKSHDKDKHKDKDKSHDHDKDKHKDKDKDKSHDKAKEKDKEKSKEKHKDKSSDKDKKDKKEKSKKDKSHDKAKPKDKSKKHD